MFKASHKGTTCWVSEARFEKDRYNAHSLVFLSMVGAKVSIRALWARMFPSSKKSRWEIASLRLETGDSVRWSSETEGDTLLRVIEPYQDGLYHLVGVRASATTQWSYEKEYFNHLGLADSAWLRRLSTHTGIPMRPEWSSKLWAAGMQEKLITLYDGFGRTVTKTKADQEKWETIVVGGLASKELI